MYIGDIGDVVVVVCVCVCGWCESNKFMRRIILCPFLKKKKKKRGKRENLFPFERRENNK